MASTEWSFFGLQHQAEGCDVSEPLAGPVASHARLSISRCQGPWGFPAWDGRASTPRKSSPFLHVTPGEGKQNWGGDCKTQCKMDLGQSGELTPASCVQLKGLSDSDMVQVRAWQTLKLISETVRDKIKFQVNAVPEWLGFPSQMGTLQTRVKQETSSPPALRCVPRRPLGGGVQMWKHSSSMKDVPRTHGRRVPLLGPNSCPP